MARADDDHGRVVRGGDPVERPGGGGVGVRHRLDRHVLDGVSVRVEDLARGLPILARTVGVYEQQPGAHGVRED